MKISEFVNNLWDKYNGKLKIIKKWIFWILLNEDAFFMSKIFNFKITILDKQTIKIWFPDWSKEKWLSTFKEKNISYILFEKKDKEFKKVDEYKANKYTNLFSIDIEDYNLSRDRILWLNKIGFEEKNEKNFLLKDKLEDIYVIYLDLLLKLPKKERYFLREKIERLFLNLFEQVYVYMYNLWERIVVIQKIFDKVLILREFNRLLYKMWKIKNDNIYLDLWEKWIEILKICKWIMKKWN